MAIIAISWIVGNIYIYIENPYSRLQVKSADLAISSLIANK